MEILNFNGRLVDCATPVVIGVLSIEQEVYASGIWARKIEQFVGLGANVIDLEVDSISEKMWTSIAEKVILLKKSLDFSCLTSAPFGGGVLDKVSDVIYYSPELRGDSSVPVIVKGPAFEMEKDYLLAKFEFFSMALRALDAGSDVILCPGMDPEHTLNSNISLIDRASIFDIHNCPLMIDTGILRSSQPAINREEEGILMYKALENGFRILRTGDVQLAGRVIQLWKNSGNVLTN